MKNAATPEPKKPRILFVCFGNLCRSPMAAGLASERLGPGAWVASAGIAAVGGPAAPDAVLVMRIVYGIDISGHSARNVGEFDLLSFDYVVAMDLSIYHHLQSLGVIPGDRLYGWSIEDPLGLGYDAFKTAAREIERRLDQFLTSQGLD
jgi:protein-tyrosine phosphatase